MAQSVLTVSRGHMRPSRWWCALAAMVFMLVLVLQTAEQVECDSRFLDVAERLGLKSAGPASGAAVTSSSASVIHPLSSSEITVQIGSGYLGCFADPGDDDRPRTYPNSPDNGPTYHSIYDCGSWAAKNNYPYFSLQYGGQCFGGTLPPAAMTVSTQCTMPCSHIPNGGNGTNSVFRLDYSLPSSPSVNYVGCFVDPFGRGGARAYPNSPNASSLAYTVASCAQWAAGFGYKYVAIQAGGQCWAGNAEPALFTPIDGCSASAGEECGGASAQSIYQVSQVIAPAYNYVGCYPIVSPVYSPADSSTAHTPQDCANWASTHGYSYFALQGGRCSGGVAVPQATRQAPSACNLRCADMCGGFWANSVYQVANQSAPPTPAFTGVQSGYPYAGCFADSLNRVLPFSPDNPLNLPYTTSTYLATNYSIYDCGAWATKNNYPYFALQYGGQCFAGFTSPSAMTASSACTSQYFCSHLPSGGPWANSVFKLNYTSNATAVSSSLISNPPPSFTYMGCFEDPAEDYRYEYGYQTYRAYPYTPDKSNYGYDINSCAVWAAAQGHAYFAIQDGATCWAGEADPQSFAKSTACKFTGEECGGSAANSVYHLLSNDSLAYSYLGCYQANATASIFGASPENPPTATHTIQDCSQWAAANHYNYFALQAGGKCLGGRSQPSQAVLSSSCTLRCGHQCGGYFASSVYRTAHSYAPPPTATPTPSTTTTPRPVSTTQPPQVWFDVFLPFSHSCNYTDQDVARWSPDLATAIRNFTGLPSGTVVVFTINCQNNTMTWDMLLKSSTAAAALLAGMLDGSFSFPEIGPFVGYPCAAGTFPNNGTCVLCPPGSYNAVRGGKCIPCAPGSISQQGSTQCSLCPAGSYSGGNQCVACSAGTYSSSVGSSSCTACAAGSSSLADATGCFICPAGSSNAVAGGLCSLCPAGTFAALPNATECLQCLPSSYASDAGSTSCTSCAANSFSAIGQPACTQCPAGTSAPPGAYSSDFCCTNAQFTSCALSAAEQIYNIGLVMSDLVCLFAQISSGDFILKSWCGPNGAFGGVRDVYAAGKGFYSFAQGNACTAYCYSTST